MEVVTRPVRLLPHALKCRLSPLYVLNGCTFSWFSKTLVLTAKPFFGKDLSNALSQNQQVSVGETWLSQKINMTCHRMKDTFQPTPPPWIETRGPQMHFNS